METEVGRRQDGWLAVDSRSAFELKPNATTQKERLQHEAAVNAGMTTTTSNGGATATGKKEQQRGNLFNKAVDRVSEKEKVDGNLFNKARGSNNEANANSNGTSSGTVTNPTKSATTFNLKTK